MRELTKHATTHELHVLMDMVHESETTTSEQAELLYAIVDELTDRGEIDEITEEEIHAALKKTMLKAKRPDFAQKPMSQTEFERMDDLRADMLKDRQRRKARRKSYFRSSVIAASVVFALFLTNTITLATGHDLFGSIARWSKDAVYFVFGVDSAVEPKQGISKEYYSLKMTLDDLGIQIDLPKHLPQGFMFASIEPDASSNIVAWFVNGDDEFSISVKQVTGASKERFNESDGEDTSEVYSNANGTYMITTNKNRKKAIWYQGIYEIKIQGNITYEQLTQMLDSI